MYFFHSVVFLSRCSSVCVDEKENGTIYIRFQLRRFSDWNDIVYVNKEMMQVLQKEFPNRMVEMRFKEWGDGPDYTILILQDTSSESPQYMDLAMQNVKLNQVAEAYPRVNALCLNFRCFATIDQFNKFEDLEWIYLKDMSQKDHPGFTNEEKEYIRKEFPGCIVDEWKDWEQ